ncbi:Apolipophorin [Nymphon striatum]|nr:Apolipophorin [Nymphon striatum]
MLNTQIKASRKELHHTLEIDVTMPTKVVKYNGEVKVNEKIYMTKQRVSYGEDVYMFNADYMVSQKKITSVIFVKGKSYISEAYIVQEGTLNKAVFDLKLDTDRNIRGMVSFNKKDSNENNKMVSKFNIFWNADKDTSERVEFHFNYDPVDDSSYASLYYPERTLTATMKPKLTMREGAVSAQLSTDFSWERDEKVSLVMNFVSTGYGRQLTTSIEARTPFTGYRSMVFKHTHGLIEIGLTSKTTALMDDNTHINLEFNGIYQDGHTTIIKGDVKFISSIEEYESLGVELEHTLSSSQFRSNATISWGRYKEMTFAMSGLDSGDYYKTSMQGQFHFTSPFDDYKTISGSLNHRLSSTQFTTTGNFKWTPTEAISFNVGGSGIKSRNKQICKVTVRIATPFSEYENIVSQLNFENDGTEMKSNGEMSWGYKKVTFGFDKSSNNEKIDGSVYLTTPYSGFESLKFTGYHELQKVSYKNMFEVQVNEDKYTIKMSGKMKPKILEAEVEIYTPIEEFKSFQSKFTHKMSGKESEYHLEVTPNEEKTTVDLKTEYKSGRKITFNWELTSKSPLIDNKQLTISGKHQTQTGSLTNLLKYKLGWKKVVLDHSFQYSSMLNFHNKIEFSHPWKNDYPQLALENRQVVSDSYASSKHTLTFDNSEFWDLKGEYRTDSSRINANFNLEDNNGKIFSVTGLYPFDDNSYNPSLNLAWRQDSKTNNMLVSAAWNLYETSRRDGEIRFTSSLEGYESLVAKIEYDLENHNKNARIVLSKNDESVSLTELVLEGSYVYDRNMNGDISLKWAPSKKVGISANLVKSDEKVVTSISFSSPFESYEKLIFTGMYDISKKKKTAEMSLEYAPYKVISLKTHIKIQKGKGNGKIIFSSPIEGLSSSSFQASYDLTKNLKRASISYQCPSRHELSFDGELNLKNDVKFAKITLKTPYEQMQSLVLSATLDTSSNLKTGNIKSIWNGDKTIELNSNFQKDSERQIKGELSFSSPFENFENIKFDFNLEKQYNTYQGLSSFSWGVNKKMSLDTMITMKPFDVSIKVDSPFDPVKNVVMKTTFSKNEDLEFELTSSLEWKNVNKINLKLQNQQVKDNELRTEFFLTTPFENFDQLRLRSSFLVTSDVIAAGFSAKTPFETLPSLEISSTYQSATFGIIDAEFQIDTDTTIFRATANTNKDSAKFYLNSPLVFDKPLTIDVTESSNMKVINFSNGYNLYTVKYSLTMEPEDKKLSMELRIPTLNYKYRTMNLDLVFANRQNQAIDMSALFRDTEDTHKIAATVSQGYKLLKGDLVLNTPLITVKSVTLMGDVQYDAEKKINVYFKTPVRTYSVVGLLGDHTSDKVNGFISLNTPADVFGTVRLDINFLNNEWTNTEGLIKMETSSENFRSASISGKFTNYGDSIESILTVETPFDNYKKITVDGKVNHDEEWKSIKPSVRLSLPSKEMIAYGEYEDTYDHNKVIFGFYEDRQQAYEFSTQVEKREYAIILSAKIPSDYTVNSYQTQMKLKNQNGRQTFDASLNLPDNERAAINGVIEIITPWEYVQAVSAVYGYSQKGYQRAHDFEIRNGGSVVTHVSATFDEGKEKVKTVALELPSLSLKSSGMLKSGKQMEMTFKVDIPSRIVFFHTVFAPTSRGFKHSTEFAWNQRQSKQASYEVFYADRSSSGISTGDLTIRLIHPIRAFEVKFSHKCTSRDTSLTTKFMWDPLRDTKKQMTVVVELQDKSVYGKNSYNGAITLKTPKLFRDVKLMGLVEFSKIDRDMFKTNLKLDYNGNRRQALVFEMKLSDDTKGRGKGKGIMYSLRSRLLQPESVTYFNTFSAIVFTPTVKKIDSRFSYVDATSKKRSFLIRSILNKKKLTMQFSSPSKSVKMIGNVQTNSADFDVTVNKEKIMLAQCSYSYKDAITANVDAVYYPTNNGLKFQAVSGKSVSVELNHKYNGKDFTDFMFTLGLRTPRVLSSRMNWRTSILTELKNEIVLVYNAQKDVMTTHLDNLVKKIKTEANYKMAAIQRVNAAELKPLMKDWKVMKNDLYYDYVVLKKQAQNMYESNEFYLQNIASVAKSISKYMCESYKLVTKKVIEKLECIKNCISAIGEASFNLVQRVASSTTSFIKTCYSDLISFFCESYYAVLETIEGLFYMVTDFIEDTVYSIQFYLERWGDQLLKNAIYFVNEYIPFVQTIEEYLEKLTDYKDAVMVKVYKSKLYKLAERYQEVIARFIEDVQAIEYAEVLTGHYTKASSKLSEAYNTVESSFDDLYSAVSEHPHIAFASEIANHGYQKVAWAYRYWGVDEALDTIYQNWYKIVSTIVTDIAHDTTSKYTAFVRDSKLVFRPDMGKFEMDLRIPSDRNSLNHIFDIYSSPEYKQLLALKEKYLPENRMTAWDYWYAYKPHSDASNWVPPFKTQALIAGKQHYMTFDKSFFDFAGQCSYLLAHDMVDGNFSVIAEYKKNDDNMPGKSIIVKADDRTVKLTREFEVLVDDEKVNLPYQFENTIITRFDNIVTLSNKKGLTVKCNFFRDVCTVEMSGWYYGKTGGLLGVYDNEPKLDMQKPNGELTKSVEDFANSWYVGNGKCNVETNFAAYSTLNPSDMKAKRICEEMFKSDYSSLRPCFKVIPTKEFMQMCLVDVANPDRYDRQTAEERSCTSAYAYKQRCLAEEVDVKMPSACRRCKKSDNTVLEEGDTFTINSENKPSAADIVFIVEEKECNKDKYTKLEELTQGIERSLREKGIGKATYTVVGYGGDGVHEKPHVHWTESHQSGNYRTIANAFRSLTVGNGKSDIYDAVLFATNLKFTPGAAKTFVLVKCGSCNGGKIKDNYSDMLWMLMNHDISFHVLMDNDFKLRSGSKKANSILGIDKFEAFTTKDVRDKTLKGDNTLRDQMYEVKDLCIPLALETNGTMFNSRRLMDKKRNIQKNFVHVFSRRLVQSTEAPNCQLCFCQPDEESNGNIECSACISPFDKGILTPNLPDISSWPESTSVITKSILSADESMKWSKISWFDASDVVSGSGVVGTRNANRVALFLDTPVLGGSIPYSQGGTFFVSFLLNIHLVLLGVGASDRVLHNTMHLMSVEENTSRNKEFGLKQLVNKFMKKNSSFLNKHSKSQTSCVCNRHQYSTCPYTIYIGTRDPISLDPNRLDKVGSIKINNSINNLIIMFGGLESSTIIQQEQNCKLKRTSLFSNASMFSSIETLKKDFLTKIAQFFPSMMMSGIVSKRVTKFIYVHFSS